MAKTVLVVDDDPANLQHIKTILQSSYSVWTFRQPQAALATVAEGIKPQLLLCNIRLPGIAGMEFREQVRTKLGLEHLPTIFFISFRERKLFEKVMNSANKYLIKPFGDLELKDVVNSFLHTPSRI